MVDNEKARAAREASRNIRARLSAPFMSAETAWHINQALNTIDVVLHELVLSPPAPRSE